VKWVVFDGLLQIAVGSHPKNNRDENNSRDNDRSKNQEALPFA
jgi:hypothetical protein